MSNAFTRFSSLGLAAKLVTVFLIFGVIPMAVVGVISFGAANEMKENSGSRFMSEAQSLADKIDRNLFERYGDVQAFGYNDAITRTSQWYDPTEYNVISQVMNKYVQAYGIYDLALLVDTKGDLIAVNYTDAQGEPIDSQFLFEKNFSRTPWFQALEAGQFTTTMPFTAPGNDISSGTFIEDVHLDPDVKQALGTDGMVMGFSAPVYDENGTVVAYWSNRTNFRVVEDIFQAAYTNLKNMGFAGAELTLLDQDGRILIDYDPMTTGTEKIVHDFDVLMKLNLSQKGVSVAQAAVQGETGFQFARHARKGISQVGGYTHLQGALGFPGMNWAVLVRVPEEEAVAGANSIQNQVMVTGLICLGLLVPLGMWIGRRGAQQVRNLQDAADQMAAGDYAARVVVRAKDEIGQLGNAFNTMAQEIEGNIAQGREYESKMEAISKAQAVIEFQLDGTILAANANFCQTVGYTEEEIKGQHHRMFVLPEEANSPAYGAFWAKLNRGEFDAGVYKRVGKGGKEVWIQASYNPIMDANGKPCKVVKFATDITQQKAIGADFEGKMEAINKAQAVIEFQLDGTILAANANFCQTVGYTEEEIKGQHHRMFVDSEEANRPAYGAFWAKLNRGEFDAGVYRRVGKGGKEVWIQASYNPIMDANGKPCKVVKFATDITAQKNAATESMRLKTALDNASTNVLVCDRNYQIIFVNKQSVKTLQGLEKDIQKALPQFAVDKVMGSSIDDYHKDPAHQRRLLDDPKNLPYGTEIHLGDLTLDLQASAIMSDTGEYLGNVVEWRDVTAEKQAQQAVDQLIGAAAKGQLADRIDVERLEGQFKTIGSNLNQLLEAVSTPMSEAQTVLSGLAEGDLSKKVQGGYEGEFDKIKSSLNTAIENLGGIVQVVRDGANNVSTASAEITQGNEDLSQRTSAQAGALEETSASMEQMTSTIKQNADNAKQANQLAVAAREVAEKGGAVTDKAVGAMEEINSSSKKIADIINVIDEIAFQTNLLALNAAVEAARAGEQGRGFAVVASEVRNLAQRSATAAKEIKALINESVQKVADGSNLVNQSGQTLAEIVNSVKRVTDIIAEISAASQEQAAGIDQVNKAVMQMDQGTQQNAALVEEATSASQSMKQQAAALLEQVAYFTLAEDKSGSKTGMGIGLAKSPASLKKPGPKDGGLEKRSAPPASTEFTPKPELVGVGSSNGQALKDEFFEEF